MRAYRRSGADGPFGDGARAHGTPLEGYYWRFTDPARGEVLIALCGVSRDAEGATWGTVALAAHPGDVVAATLTDTAWADPAILGVRAGTSVLHGDRRGLQVSIDEGARLEAVLEDVVGWPRRLWGGVGAGHLVPGLSQYWLPWCLGARVRGSAVLGGREIDLDGTIAYAEKNWGHGFPPEWWWGQAHGFADPDVCVAFAGGELQLGRSRPRVTALVLRLPGGRVLRRGEPLVNGVRAEVGAHGWRLSGGGIELTGTAEAGEGCELPVPIPDERRAVRGARQHLAGTVELVVRRRGGVVYRGTSHLAGLERGHGLSSLPPWPQIPSSSPTSSPAPSPRTSAPAT